MIPVILAAIVLLVLIMRLVGAWMLRIDVLIKNQYTIIGELRKLNSNNQKKIE